MSVQLTKQAVAARLLQSAIRSHLRDDDRVATYLLASASARLLADLSEKAGADWLDLNLRRGLYYWAIDFEAATFTGPPALRDILSRLASSIAAGDIKGPENLSLSGFGRAERRQLHGALNKEYNFLKHADADALASISEEEIDCFHALARAAVIFEDLFPHIDVEEISLFKYLSQRAEGNGYSRDVEPYSKTFDEIPEDDIKKAVLSYLSFSSRP